MELGRLSTMKGPKTGELTPDLLIIVNGKPLCGSPTINRLELNEGDEIYMTYLAEGGRNGDGLCPLDSHERFYTAGLHEIPIAQRFSDSFSSVVGPSADCVCVASYAEVAAS